MPQNWSLSLLKESLSKKYSVKTANCHTADVKVFDRLIAAFAVHVVDDG